MRKTMLIFLAFVFVCVIIGKSYGNSVVYNETNKNKDDVRAIFVSYIELNKYVKNNDIDSSKKNIIKMIENTKSLGFNTLIVQIRSFADAIYDSDIFPWSSTVSSSEGIFPGYDVLDFFIEEAHKHGISIYGWINPYRVRSTTSEVSIKSPAYKYIGTDYLFEDGGIYFNPSKSEVEDLIVDGVLEVVSNYKVDGILFDDYFYPNEDMDYIDYLKYLESNSYISFNDYHLMVINRMIKRVHEACAKYGVIFGVSPDGNIENNYKKVFADVYEWLKSSQYVDFIMPQVYYGFYNERKGYKNVIDEWNGLIKNEKIDLYIALAFYKVGVEDKYALRGKNEWLENDDIIMREIVLARNLEHYRGFSLFRYDYLFDPAIYSNMTEGEIENMKKVLN